MQDSSAARLFAQALVNLLSGDFDGARRWFATSSEFASQETRAAFALESVHEIPVSCLGWVHERATVIARKCTKLGVAAVAVETLAQDERTALVRVTGDAPLVGGCKLLARLDFLSAGVLVSCAPGVEGAPAWRDVEPGLCDHCHTRRRRSCSFVVEREDGVRVIVGHNCLADFVRSADVAASVLTFGFIRELTEEQELSPGDRVRGKGTVKKHESGKYGEQTILSRCALEVAS